MEERKQEKKRNSSESAETRSFRDVESKSVTKRGHQRSGKIASLLPERIALANACPGKHDRADEHQVE